MQSLRQVGMTTQVSMARRGISIFISVRDGKTSYISIMCILQSERDGLIPDMA